MVCLIICNKDSADYLDRTAALHLGHHLLHRPSILNLPDPAISENSKRKGILELGAGTGFLSCLLAQQGYRVVSTDLGDVIGGGIPPLERLEHNVKLSMSSLIWLVNRRAKYHG